MRLSPLTLLLFATSLAPACAPDPAPEAADRPQNVVILTDSTRWQTDHLRDLRRRLEADGARVLMSGDTAETAASLVGRLPWLLQPGVDTFYYDAQLAGPAAFDSLRSELARLQHPARTLRVEKQQ